MPTRSKKTGSKKTGTSGTKKTGKSPAARKTAKRRAKKSSDLDTFGIDPPIIIDGGGLNSGTVGGSLSTAGSASVILRSAVDLVPLPPDGDYPFVYRIDVDVKWMDWQGVGHQKGKSKNGKDFTLHLHNTDET